MMRGVFPHFCTQPEPMTFFDAMLVSDITVDDP
jgi:hypothetical protein